MVLIRQDFTPRLYQETILATATQHNTLVVLPTGLGKTAIAALLAAQRLNNHANGKILFLAPTKPLAQQHLNTFKEFFTFPEESFALFTGHVKPEKRARLWREATFIFSTPQGLENDIISRKITLEDVILLIVDEAHRATGDYAYVFITKHYHAVARHERILGLTASPGSNEDTIKEVCTNLYIEKIEVRTYDDPDVKDYVQQLDVMWEHVTLTPTIKKIRDYLQSCYDSRLQEAHSLGYLPGKTDNYNKSTILSLQGALIAKTAHGERTQPLLRTISLLAEALKIQHALELCETQTINALHQYFSQLQTQARKTKVKAVQRLVNDVRFRSAVILTHNLLEKGEEHPKIPLLKKIIGTHLTNNHQKIIIFTQYRDTAVTIQQHLTGITSKIFVGQAKKGTTGMSQKEQKRILDEFREGLFNVLIATSVAEEGLDIPSVDVVIFYEPIPSAIRTVQRRGRTGRHTAGKVIVLVTKNTRDEAYRWAAHHKEKQMYRNLKKIKQHYTPTTPQREEQQSLTNFSNEATITVDYREKGSPVMKALINAGARLELAQLPTGDYKINDITIEYKTVKDFVDSIIDGRLLSQLTELRKTYKPLIIIEGKEDLYAQRNINPESIRGMIATITTSYQIPLIRTMSSHETAMMILTLARRENKERTERHYHTHKPWSLKEQQERIVASLPGVEATLAKKLLEHFGTVTNVMNATTQALQDVPLIGPKKAQHIRQLLDATYDNAKNNTTHSQHHSQSTSQKNEHPQ